MKNFFKPANEKCRDNITVEAILVPKRNNGTELISLPRAEYERLIRRDEAFNRFCKLLGSESLSAYTIGEVVKAMFPEEAPIKAYAPGAEIETPTEGKDDNA